MWTTLVHPWDGSGSLTVHALVVKMKQGHQVYFRLLCPSPDYTSLQFPVICPLLLQPGRACLNPGSFSTAFEVHDLRVVYVADVYEPRLPEAGPGHGGEEIPQRVWAWGRRAVTPPSPPRTRRGFAGREERRVRGSGQLKKGAGGSCWVVQGDWVVLSLAFPAETVSLPGLTHPRGSEPRTSGQTAVGKGRGAQGTPSSGNQSIRVWADLGQLYKPERQ